MSLWVSKFMQCSLQHWSSQHQEVCTWHLQKKRTMFFNPSAGRGEDTSTFTIFTPYQDIEAQGASVLVDETLNFGFQHFRRWETRHRTSWKTRRDLPISCPSTLSSISAQSLNFFQSMRPEAQQSMEEAEAEVRWEILRDSKVANGRIIRIEAILDSLTLPFFFVPWNVIMCPKNFRSFDELKMIYDSAEMIQELSIEPFEVAFLGSKETWRL